MKKFNSLQLKNIEIIDEKLKEHNLEQKTPYINIRTKIKVKSTITGEEWSVLPNTILYGQLISPSERSVAASKRVLNITDRTAKGVDYFIEKLKDVHGDKYKYIDGYKNLESNCTILCHKCSETFKTKPKYLLKGHNCPKCANKKIEKNTTLHERFAKKFYSITNGDYTLLSEYTGQYNKILVRHEKCGNEYMVTPKYFMRGDRCSICIETKISHTFEKFKNYINLVEPTYEIVSEFKGRKKPIILRNTVLNEEYKTTPDKFIAGVRSPLESASKGEILIRGILNKNNIEFKANYKEQKLSDKKPLEFDFFIKKDDTIYLIEYNGIQHYIPVEIFGGEKCLLRNKKHDKMKLDFCTNENIPFLVIPYTLNSKEVEDEIKKFLKL